MKKCKKKASIGSHKNLYFILYFHKKILNIFKKKD